MLKQAVVEAERELDLALPHLIRARDILAEALGLDPAEWPEVDSDKPAEWNATRLFQNVWSAHLHVEDRYGS